MEFYFQLMNELEHVLTEILYFLIFQLKYCIERKMKYKLFHVLRFLLNKVSF